MNAAQRVADQLTGMIAAGTAPWMQPWEPGLVRPSNPITGTVYRGSNALVLLAEAQARGYTDTRWVTLRQANEAGTRIRRGEHGVTLAFWQFHRREPVLDASGQPTRDAEGQPVMRETRLSPPMVRVFTVFHASQLEDPGVLPAAKSSLTEQERIEAVEEMISKTGARIQHGYDHAGYDPLADRIVMPARETFTLAGGYYATLFHELAHWTGHPERLNRHLTTDRYSPDYAREELRAEISSFLVCLECEVGYTPHQHAAYVGEWLEQLRASTRPMELLKAATDAERIVAYVQHDLVHKPELRHRPQPESGEPLRQATPVDPIGEFREFLRSAGFKLEGEPLMDGRIHRCKVEGDKHGSVSGSYCGHLDGLRPAGWAQNFRTGDKLKWKASMEGPELSPEERRERMRQQARAIEERKAEIAAEQKEAAILARAVWSEAQPAAGHPYVEKKGVQPSGVRQTKDGRLVLPLRNAAGQIETLHWIGSDGSKGFLKGGKLSGNYALLGEAEPGDSVLVCEGWATGATLHAATGLPVAVAATSTNLVAVAKALAQNHQLIICGDNDHLREAREGLNPGKIKATEAAEATGAQLALPQFAAGETGSDWNDYAVARGLDAVRLAVMAAEEPAMKQTQGVEM